MEDVNQKLASVRNVMTTNMRQWIQGTRACRAKHTSAAAILGSGLPDFCLAVACSDPALRHLLLPLCVCPVELAIDRGERLEVIEAKSDTLLEDSNKFAAQAASTKRMFCRRYWRMVLIMTIIGAIILALIIWAAAK